MRKLILLLMILGIMSSCSKDDHPSQIIEMRINHFQGTGIGVAPVLTLLVQKGDNIGSDNWTKFYSGIEGFKYEPGIIYNLIVKEIKVNSPREDGSSVKYSLVEIKSTQAVDDQTLFDIDLKMDGESFITSHNGLKLLNKIWIDCNNLCNELESSIQSRDDVVGTFKRITSDKIQLTGLR